MTRFVKILFLILAVVTLPLRAVAAVAMWNCGPDHHGSVVIADHEHAHAGFHVVEHDHVGHDPVSHGHGAHEHHDESLALQDGDNPSPSASACSACAACCVGGAVALSAWSSFLPAPPGTSRIPFAEQRISGTTPDQLDRPPLV
jgi:hypothetical protein